MRWFFALIGGSVLTLALFTLLAWLVAPPDAPLEPREALVLEMVEPSASAAAAPAESSTSTPAPLPPVPVTPAPPPPAPAPNVESAIALPDPEIPTLELPTPSLDSSLPELVETPPEPKPQPEPPPRPTPHPTPTPTPSPSSTSAASGPATDSSRTPGASTTGTEGEDGDALRAIHWEEPQTPTRARRRGIEGHIVLRFTIQTDGRVDRDSIQVVEAQPPNIYERATISALLASRFEPMKTPKTYKKRYVFNLE